MDPTQCTKDAPFEIVHTAERALENLVAAADPVIFFGHMLPFISVSIDLDDRSNPPALLSALRTLRYLVGRLPVDYLEQALPTLLPQCRCCLNHKSVDMRKATVFALVEMHFVLLRKGEETDMGLLDGVTDCQRRLVEVYIDRHPKDGKLVTC